MKSYPLSVALCLISSMALAQPLFTLHEQGEAPSRTYDVLHYKIDIALDLVNKSLTGSAAITLVPFTEDFRTLVLDAEEMTIRRATIRSTEMRSELHEKKLTLHLDRPYSSKDTLNVLVEYSCMPKTGMNWSRPDSGYPRKRWQVWSQGEAMSNHFWFPCYDFPNDKATSEVIATVDKKFTVLSNGKLLGVKEDKKNGTKTFHWRQDRPHVSYLIMVAAGEYAVLHDRVGRLPLDYYVYPDDTLNARICFQQTPDMIRFFNQQIGFAYPWEKYAQIILQDHFGGMENTSATTLSDLSTVYDARVRLDNSPIGLIAHELAHQWWGDVVTCKDWRHLWLNESFASYFEPLYRRYFLGQDEFDYEMYGSQQAGINVDTSRGRKPVVSVESYGANIYPRGAAVLHMLRFVLGDELFWRGIKHYLNKYQFTPVETNDLKIAFEEAAGQNLYWFFDEWLYKAGHPIFNVSYQWSDSAKAVLVNVRQTHTMDSITGVFSMPVDIEVTASAAAVTHRVNILTKDTTFTLPCATKPELVIFDKGNWLIKELKFDKSADEWALQAGRAADPVDRVRALQELAKLPDNERYIPVFINRMISDPFWAVRQEAISQSAKTEFKDSSLKQQTKTALITASRNPKSAVRDAAIGQLGRYKGKDVVEILLNALQDSSYNVISSALRSLAKADSANAMATLREYLDYPSFRSRVSNTALNALARIDSLQGITLSFQKAAYGMEVTTRYTALGILNKYGKDRSDVRAFYLSLLNDKNEGIRSNAARTLGDIGDDASIPTLQNIADDKQNSAKDAAKESIEKIKKKSAGKN